MLTGFGVKPIGIGQWKRENYYLYGIIEPATGCDFFYEFSHLDTTCFQTFLELFSQTYPQDFHIIQLDNGTFHTAHDLIVPDNIILLFQPSHCQATFWGEASPQKLAPELNPIERLWEHIKSFLGWQLFNDLDELREKVRRILNSFTPETIVSLTGWNYILQASSVAGI